MVFIKVISNHLYVEDKIYLRKQQLINKNDIPYNKTYFLR